MTHKDDATPTAPHDIFPIVSSGGASSVSIPSGAAAEAQGTPEDTSSRKPSHLPEA